LKAYELRYGRTVLGFDTAEVAELKAYELGQKQAWRLGDFGAWERIPLKQLEMDADAERVARRARRVA
jgi:hypothetical protein